MGSSMSRQPRPYSQVLSFFAGLGWSLHVSRLLATRHAMLFRTRCETSLAVRRRNGGHNVADYGLCRSRHREESMPIDVSFGRVDGLVVLLA